MRSSDWSSDVCSSDLTIGRAARNVDGRVILYADRMTNSLTRALAETERRRAQQQAWHAAHGITPQSIKKNIADNLSSVYERSEERRGGEGGVSTCGSRWAAYPYIKKTQTRTTN